MHRKPLAAALAGLSGFISTPVFSQSIQNSVPLLDEIVVTATRIPTPDIVAPYASEVHTQTMIEQSGASTLYDYLARQTSLVVMPSSGNRSAPLIDMRGYGSESGYQNIVVTVDGRRLNNIDLVPQLLGGIPLADVERIEITKGSGSVIYGDGATAGTIQIYTRAHQGVGVAASVGSHGALAGTLTAGASGDGLTVSASLDASRHDGYSDPDPTGHRDEAHSRIARGDLTWRPRDGIRLDLGLSSSRLDNRYVSYLFPAQFESDPNQLGNNPWTSPVNAYTHQTLDSDLWRLGAEFSLAPDWSLVLRHSREDKRSAYVTWASIYDYDSRDDEVALRHQGTDLDLTAGVQSFDGLRSSGTDRTRKENLGAYVQILLHLGEINLSAGVRRERVEYSYQPTGSATLERDHLLTAWDFGVNRKLGSRSSVFASLNQAFQAPDVDRFFKYNFGVGSYVFNTFIVPTRSRTLNLGLNHSVAGHRLKITVFRGGLKNEIYYEPTTGENTNLDRSRKYGLEAQDTWRINDAFTASLNYTWTRARIDREADNGGVYTGKDLPGVPENTAVLGLAWRTDPAAGTFHITHTWRSGAWSIGDFDNNATRQRPYQSTDITYRRQVGEVEWFAAVDNLFARKNGVWVDDPIFGSVIYPVNFTRNFRIGLQTHF